jgi:hypothetical protein
MEREGTVATFGPGPAPARRVIVLLDHPEGGRAIDAQIKKGLRPGVDTLSGPVVTKTTAIGQVF